MSFVLKVIRLLRLRPALNIITLSNTFFSFDGFQLFQKFLFGMSAVFKFGVRKAYTNQLAQIEVNDRTSKNSFKLQGVIITAYS